MGVRVHLSHTTPNFSQVPWQHSTQWSLRSTLFWEELHLIINAKLWTITMTSKGSKCSYTSRFWGLMSRWQTPVPPWIYASDLHIWYKNHPPMLSLYLLPWKIPTLFLPFLIQCVHALPSRWKYDGHSTKEHVKISLKSSSRMSNNQYLICVQFHIDQWHALVHAIVVLGNSVHSFWNIFKDQVQV